MTLDELQALRAARKDRDDLPDGMTRREVDAYTRDTALLDRRLQQARDAKADLLSLASDDDDTEWLAHEESWRKVLCDELLALPSRIRDPKLLGRRVNL